MKNVFTAAVLLLSLLALSCREDDEGKKSEFLRFSDDVAGNAYTYVLNISEEEYSLKQNAETVESGVFETTDAGYRFTPGSGEPYEGMSDGNLYIPADQFPWEDEAFNGNALYTLNVSARNGSVTVDPERDEYEAGTSVTLTATPDAGSVFTGWSGDASGSENPLRITMEGNMSIVAGFEKEEGSHDIHGAWNLVHEESVILSIVDGDTLADDWSESYSDTVIIGVFNTTSHMFELHDNFDNEYWYDEWEFSIEGNALLGDEFQGEWNDGEFSEVWHTEFALQGNSLEVTTYNTYSDLEAGATTVEVNTQTLERYDGPVPPDHWDTSFAGRSTDTESRPVFGRGRRKE
ncbi:MAG: InlB B-repeat-containing protein [Fibrobacterota bacterium]